MKVDKETKCISHSYRIYAIEMVVKGCDIVTSTKGRQQQAVAHCENCYEGNLLKAGNFNGIMVGKMQNARTYSFQ